MIVIISIFTTIFLLEELNISMRYKILFNKPLRKHYKLLECLPCFSFWFSLLLTLIFAAPFYTPLLTFIIVKFYDRYNQN